VRVSALTRYSGHLFSRLSRGVPNMYKQMAWPPLGRKGTGTEWEEIMREAWVNGCGFMVSGGLARLTSAPFALGRMATALGRSLRVRRKGWGHHSGPHLGWREGWLTRELFSHSAWGGRKAFLSSLRRRRERRGLRAGIEGLGIAEVKNGNVICEAAMRKQLAKGHDRPPARCCLGPAYFFFRN
jgi:hypothetical protein